MAQITLPHQLTNGTVADASQVMDNFYAIVNVVNGNLGADNLSSISGSDIIVTDMNGGNIVLNNFTRRFAAGSVSFNDVPPNTLRTQTVRFPIAFPGSPFVFVEIRSTNNPHQVFCSVSNTTASSVDINTYHTLGGPRSYSVSWFAVYTGSFS